MHHRIPQCLFLLFAALLIVGCESAQSPAPASPPEMSTGIFPRGDQAPDDHFTGTVYVRPLIENDTVYTLTGGNVEFTPGARSDWHSHPAGQILIVTEGVGYHQIRGKARETIRKGDVVRCPPNTDHWHGASAESGMTHIYLLPNTERGIVNWGAAVTDAEFAGK